MHPVRAIVFVAAALAAPGVHGAAHAQGGERDSAHNAIEFVALTYNVAGLPELLSGSEPTRNSPLISPLLNAYQLVLLQEDWDEPIDIGGTPLLFHHDAIVAEARHPYRSEPAPAPLGTDLDRLPTGPPLIADGLNRLSNFPFGDVLRVKWRSCHGELLITVLEEVLSGAGLDDVADALGVDGGATDCAAQKGFSVARTTFAEGLSVDVYNLHAEAGGGPEDQTARRDNFVQLAEFMNTFSVGNAVILGGDTNLHTGLESRRPVDRDIWTAFQDATGVTDVCVVLDCGGDAGAIDKFAFRSSEAVEVTPRSHRFESERFTRSDGEPLSDHDPLAVRFTIAPVVGRTTTSPEVAAADATLADTGAGHGGSATALALLAVTLLLTRHHRAGGVGQRLAAT